MTAGFISAAVVVATYLSSAFSYKGEGGEAVSALFVYFIVPGALASLVFIALIGYSYVYHLRWLRWIIVVGLFVAPVAYYVNSRMDIRNEERIAEQREILMRKSDVLAIKEREPDFCSRLPTPRERVMCVRRVMQLIGVADRCGSIRDTGELEASCYALYVGSKSHEEYCKRNRPLTHFNLARCYLIKNAVPPWSESDKNQTPLMTFATGGYLYNIFDSVDEAIDSILKTGVPVNAQDDDGNTALHLAQTEEVARSLSRTADSSIKNKKGQTPYEFHQYQK